MTNSFRYHQSDTVHLKRLYNCFEQAEIEKSNKGFCVYLLEEIMIGRYVDDSENMLLH